MHNIRLTEDEKTLLKNTHKHTYVKGCLPSDRLNFAAKSLKEKGLIYTNFSLDGLYDARLTPKGDRYKEENPKLKNGLTKLQKNLLWTFIISLFSGILLLILEPYLKCTNNVQQPTQTNTPQTLLPPVEDCKDTLQ